jgi:hypothetical protein
MLNDLLKSTSLIILDARRNKESVPVSVRAHLSSDVPYCEANIFVLDSLHIEPCYFQLSKFAI